MQISKLIQRLQEIQNQHGDIQIDIFQYDGEGETTEPDLIGFENDDGEITKYTLGDSSWAESFFECE